MPVKALELIQLPDTLRNWPWPRHLNPYYEVCKEESAAWLETFQAFTPKAQKAFNRCDFSESFFLVLLNLLKISSDLLASLAYPLLDKGEEPKCIRMSL